MSVMNDEDRRMIAAAGMQLLEDARSRMEHDAALAEQNRLLLAFVRAWQDAQGYSPTSRHGERLAAAHQDLVTAGIIGQEDK